MHGWNLTFRRVANTSATDFRNLTRTVVCVRVRACAQRRVCDIFLMRDFFNYLVIILSPRMSLGWRRLPNEPHRNHLCRAECTQRWCKPLPVYCKARWSARWYVWMCGQAVNNGPLDVHPGMMKSICLSAQYSTSKHEYHIEGYVKLNSVSYILSSPICCGRHPVNCSTMCLTHRAGSV